VCFWRRILREMMPILSIFKPPFRGLLPLLWLCFVLCFVLHPQSAIMHGRLIDPDDTMYALQSAELLDGQGWYDRIEHRINPPDGVPFHFARLMELPYAATIGALTPLTGRADALLVTSALWPPIFLLGLLFIYRKQARLFLPKKWIGLTAFICMLAQGLLFDFMPGHIDHHGFVALLVNLCLCFVLSMLACPRKIKPAIAAGVTMAFVLSIALEVLPWLLAFSAFIGIWACLKPERAKPALAYSAVLSLGGLLLLPTYRTPSDLFTADLITFSSVYIVLLLGITLCFGTVWLLRKKHDATQRVAIAGIFAAVAGALFLYAFPQLLQGPYGALDSRLIDLMLNIKEAIPLIDRTSAASLFVGFLPWPLLALGVCAWQLRVCRCRLRQLWLLIAVMQLLALVLALFYESRYVPYAQLFGIIPLAFLLWRLTRRATPLRAVACVAVALFYPIGTMAFVYNMPALNAVLYPMMSYTPDCDVSAAARALERPPYNTGAPKLILNAMNQGPDLLLETRHTVLSAPFGDIDGNLDALNFFRADNAQAAEQIIRRRKADFVLLCRNVDRGYLLADPLSLNTALPHPFIKMLLTGDLPNWLSPVMLDEPSDILLFHVISKSSAP